MINIKYFLLISAIVLFIYVFYKWLMRYLRKDDINIPFTYLFPFEKDFFSGMDLIKLDLPVDAHVRAEILSQTGDLVLLAFEDDLKKGIVEKQIDFSKVESGKYNLRIVFPDQTITRFIEVTD